MDRNNWRIEAPPTLGSAYEYTVGGKTLTGRPRYIASSDGVRTVTLGEIDPNVRGQISPDDPAKLVFADVLGEGSGVNIELVLERAALHQNVVFAAPPALPEGLDAETARLYVYTELGLDALTADGSVGVKAGDTPIDVSANGLATARNTDDPIAFTVEEQRDGETREVVLHQFVESSVWDSAERPNETRAARQLWRNPQDAKTYLVESIPCSFLAEAEGAVTLDYVTRNGTTSSNETWRADATYYVSGTLTIGGGYTLTIEPGTVVKFASGTAINVTTSGAKVIAKGEPYNYIVFTSKNDDESGEKIHGSDGSPAAGDYTRRSTSARLLRLDMRHRILQDRLCDRRHQRNGVDFGKVRHCIIRACSSDGIYLSGNAMPDLLNNLIVGCSHHGVSAYITSSGPYCYFDNNTIDDCGHGIDAWTTIVKPPIPFPTIIMRDNLVTNNDVGLCRTPTSYWGYVYADHCGYRNTINRAYVNDNSPVDLDVSPYETTDTQLGGYFIDTAGDGNPSTKDGSNLVNAGYTSFSTVYGSGAQFDIAAPEVVDEDIDGNAHWEKRSVYSGTVDIGYHHPRIDKLIASNITCGSGDMLTIDEGVVVAFDGSSSRLIVANDGDIYCDGTATDYIVLVGGRTVSMDIETMESDNTEGMINVYDAQSPGTVSVTYTRFIGSGHIGFSTERDLADSQVRHCTFEHCSKGVSITDADVVMKNLLFDRCSDCGVYADLEGEGHTFSVRNCTFSRKGTHGIRIENGEHDDTSITVKDCLFTNLTYGIRLDDEPSVYGTLDLDYDAYYTCAYRICLAYKSPWEQGDLGEHSLLLDASPYPDSADWQAQWCLVQNGTTITPCVDGGSQSAAAAGLGQFTTSIDWFDVGTVDIGYHYPHGSLGTGAVTGFAVTHFYFNGDTTELTISVTFNQSRAWKIEIFDPSDNMALVWSCSDTGASINETWDGDGEGDGNYIVKISSNANPNQFSAFFFNCYLDTGGLSLDILSPGRKHGTRLLGRAARRRATPGEEHRWRQQGDSDSLGSLLR